MVRGLVLNIESIKSREFVVLLSFVVLAKVLVVLVA